MSESVVATLPPAELAKATAAYRRAAQKALSSTSFQSDLRAAQLAPVLFLERSTHFEFVFDRIIHHLHQSLAKAADDAERARIERVGEELFHQHLYFVVAQIENLRQRANRNLFQRIRDFFGSASNSAQAAPIAGRLVLVDLVPDAVAVLEAYFTKLVTEWTLQRDEAVFYGQVARLLRKMASAEISTGRLTLLRNYYLGQKNLLLPLVILHENIECAMALLPFDSSDEERLRTVFIVIDTLANAERFEEVKTVCRVVRVEQPSLYPRSLQHASDRFRASLEKAHREGITSGGCAANGCVSFLGWMILIGYLSKQPGSQSKGPLLITLALLTLALAYPLAMAYASVFIGWKLRAFRKEI